MELRYNINLLEDGSVVTRDGEFLGTYHLDAEDHPWFIPDGATEPVLGEMFFPIFWEAIENWHRKKMGLPPIPVHYLKL
ncbi:hypothetical protein [Agrobacterium tumefaciens]|uniref:hypothetical protein n=1 Tax=Agrobacterium tumefaciens TaxID=358 RepID=UPI00157731BD|nr:hypothetical protein [Agrobacterium tumefaciens]NTZ90482.1 hypothetical protein [Agrobacterium tumefaciens]